MIGPLDADSHHVAYDRKIAWLCSEPHAIDFHSSSSLMQMLNSRIESDPRPFREKLAELIPRLYDAERRARAQIIEKIRTESPAGFSAERQGFPLQRGPDLPAIPSRVSRPLSETERQLREASDMAARLFDAQLIIVQPRS
jgi:hypothetical protein